MFAVLGEIAFQVLDGPERVESIRSWDYAEHRVVGDLPRLQWIADGLETLTIEMFFHASFMDPAFQLAALIAAASDHSARALVFGNGDHRGYFVVTSLQTISTQADADGALIAATVRATLRQWAPGAETDPSAPPRPPFEPIGIVPTSGVYARPSSTRTQIAGSANVYMPPAIAAPGVSPILIRPNNASVQPSSLEPGDVRGYAIVRTAQ